MFSIGLTTSSFFTLQLEDTHIIKNRKLINYYKEINFCKFIKSFLRLLLTHYYCSKIIFFGYNILSILREK